MKIPPNIEQAFRDAFQAMVEEAEHSSNKPVATEFKLKLSVRTRSRVGKKRLHQRVVTVNEEGETTVATPDKFVCYGHNTGDTPVCGGTRDSRVIPHGIGIDETNKWCPRCQKVMNRVHGTTEYLCNPESWDPWQVVACYHSGTEHLGLVWAPDKHNALSRAEDYFGKVFDTDGTECLAVRVPLQHILEEWRKKTTRYPETT